MPDRSQLPAQVKQVFLNDDEFHSNLTVTCEDYPDGSYTVKVSQMYSHINLTFAKLKRLAELFGTENFNVNNWSQQGCETCDSGSSYTHEFHVPKESQ